MTRYALTVGAWVASQMSTAWWAYELGVLNSTRPVVPTSSVVVDDFSGMGVAWGWLVVATCSVACLAIVLLVFGGVLMNASKLSRAGESTWEESVALAFLGNACVIVAPTAVTVTYAWTVATLPSIGPVMNAHAPNISRLALQHVALGSTLVFSAAAAAWMHTTQPQVVRLVRGEVGALTKAQ